MPPWLSIGIAQYVDMTPMAVNRHFSRDLLGSVCR